MTKQITIKLNHDLFRPLIDEMKNFGGGVVSSDSDLVAKCLYYVYVSINLSLESGKTRFDLITEQMGIDKSEAIVKFLNDYYRFKRDGFKKLQ